MKDFLRHLKQFSIILVICYVIVIALNYSFSKNDGYSYLNSLIIVFTYTFGIYVANSLVLSDYYLKRKKNLKNIFLGGIWVNLLTIIVVFVINIIGVNDCNNGDCEGEEL